MKTAQDIEDLEDSGWGDEEIVREIEIRRGLTPEESRRWLDMVRSHDNGAEARAERAEMASDWRREGLQVER